MFIYAHYTINFGFAAVGVRIFMVKFAYAHYTIKTNSVNTKRLLNLRVLSVEKIKKLPNIRYDTIKAVAPSFGAPPLFFLSLIA
ncbi:MAG: hypothetical protein M0R40_01780 [Firmicutes bacterium]|nr:hypothetical protein [Bacillota bacterium]